MKFFCLHGSHLTLKAEQIRIVKLESAGSKTETAIWNPLVPKQTNFPFKAFFSIGFSHHRTILAKVKDVKERIFYASQKIFTRNEIQRIKKELESRVPNPRAYAVLLAIETGMRSGELCALQWSDIGPRDIHIHRQQLLRTNHGKREGFYEVPYTKDERRHPHGGRYFPLTDNCRWILAIVRANSEEGSKYVFTENGTWISKTSYELFLKRICRG